MPLLVTSAAGANGNGYGTQELSPLDLAIAPNGNISCFQRVSVRRARRRDQRPGI